MTETIVADFTADVDLSNWEEETPCKMRVLMSEEQIVFAADDAKRSVRLTDVFDIIQDVSSQKAADSTETVTLAFQVGEVREVASISERVETLIRFQQVLFKQLLNGMTVAIKHKTGEQSQLYSTSQFSLSVTPSHIQLEANDENVSTNIAIPRANITEFKTANDSFGGEQQQPVVTLYTVTDQQPGKTVICLPSFRLLNLLGRYLQATLTLDTTEERSTQGGPINLLFVDDDPDDLEMGELFLKQESERFSITTATSAAGGLDALAGDSRFDCVVSDFEMPGMNGLAFHQKVREQYPSLPFILFTGQGSEAVAKQAILDDVTDYVEKDIGTEQYEILAERIMKAVR